MDSLTAMGFSENAAKRALHHSQGSVAVAVNWLTSHSGDTDLDAQFEVPAATAAAEPAGAAAAPAAAKSIRCVETGRLFPSMAAAQLYAERTGRTDFEETDEAIVPLTAEEKAAKMEALQQKLAAKRSARAEEEKQAKVQGEKRRRADGAMMLKMKEQMAAQQLDRDQHLRAKEKKRVVDERARLRIEIAKDKAERAAAKALREGRAPPAPPSFEAAAVGPTVTLTTVDRITQLADALEMRRTGGVGLTAISTLLVYVKNAATKEEEKYRSINKANKAYAKRVGHLRAATAILRLAGFSEDGKSEEFPSGRFIFKASTADRSMLDSAIAILSNAKRRAKASAT